MAGWLRRTLVGLSCVLVAGCGTNELDSMCTLAGAEDALTLVAPKTVGGEVVRYRVRLCQGDSCEAIWFPATEAGADAAYRKHVRRVPVTRAIAYRMTSDAFAGRWNRSSARVTVTGLDNRGAVVVKRAETFELAVHSPNGPDCEPHVLLHSVRLTASDQT